MKGNGNSQLEPVRAMLAQAVAEARTRGAERVSALHVIMYDCSPEAVKAVRTALEALTPGSPVENAQLYLRPAPSRAICWNCRDLRFQINGQAVCPACGNPWLTVPSDITFALERVDTV